MAIIPILPVSHLLLASSMDEGRLKSELEDLRNKETKIRKGLAGHGSTEAGQSGSGSSPALRYTWLGAEFAAIFFGFVYGGHFLDQRLGTKPWLMLLCICLGFGLALYRLIFVAKRLGGGDA